MKRLMFAIFMVLLISTIAYAQEAWFEAAESCAVDYEISISREIPVQKNTKVTHRNNVLKAIQDDLRKEVNHATKFNKAAHEDLTYGNRDYPASSVDFPTPNARKGDEGHRKGNPTFGGPPTSNNPGTPGGGLAQKPGDGGNPFAAIVTPVTESEYDAEAEVLGCGAIEAPANEAPLKNTGNGHKIENGKNE